VPDGSLLVDLPKSASCQRFECQTHQSPTYRLRNRSEIVPDFREPGALVRVIAVGKVVSAGGVAVQMTALEVREGVMYAHWRAHSVSPRWLGLPEVVVSDSVGTRYGVMSGHGGGNDLEMSGEMWIGPTVPDGPGELTIEIKRFGSSSPLIPLREGVAQGPLVGPWRFVIGL
jgi:hypothetical protein